MFCGMRCNGFLALLEGVAYVSDSNWAALFRRRRSWQHV